MLSTSAVPSRRNNLQKTVKLLLESSVCSQTRQELAPSAGLFLAGPVGFVCSGSHAQTFSVSANAPKIVHKVKFLLAGGLHGRVEGRAVPHLTESRFLNNSRVL